MSRHEGNYMSLDPETAMRGVRSDMTDRELLEVAFNARCGVARRIALVRLRDPRMMVSFAKEDPEYDRAKIALERAEVRLKIAGQH